MIDTIDSRSILMGQIQMLEQQINQVEDKLKEGLKIDNDLYKSVQVPFANRISQQRKGLSELRNKMNSSSNFYAIWWDDFREVKDNCAALFGESLAFLEGAIARRKKWDNGLCRIADGLLYDLGHRTDIGRNRFTILAGDEFYHELAGIVRIRFPETGIWDLPIAAHEFGHYVGPHLEIHDGIRPLHDLLEQEKGRGIHGLQQQAYWQEYFADLFASYTLGPAYAAVCLLLRFDPRSAYKEWDLHPSYAKRAYCILQGLDRIPQNIGADEFVRVNEYLRKKWQQILVAAGQKGTLDQAEKDALNKKISKIFGWLEFRAEARLVDGAMLRASSLAGEIQQQIVNVMMIEPSITEEFTLIDIINGTWYWRLFNWDMDEIILRRVSEAMVGRCSKIIKSKS